MTTSAQTSLTSISSPDQELSPRQLAFFEGLAQNRAHEIVLGLIEPLARDGKLSRASLAKKIRRNPSQVTRWLGSPGNWTLQTLGLLLGAIGYVPVITAQPIDQRITANYENPAADYARLALRFIDPVLTEKPNEDSANTAELGTQSVGGIRILNLTRAA